MAARGEAGGAVPVARGRCRCGHLPTHHIVVRPTEPTGGFRLVPAGPCEICGASACRAYTPGAPG